MGSADVNAKAKEAAKRASKMPESVQYAILQVVPNILNGAFWGFTNMKDIEKHVSAIKNSGNNIIARKLGNACLLEANPNYLIQAVQVIDPEAITQKDIQVMQQKRAEANVALEKFLISKGKSETKVGAKFGGTVGIYCINDVNSVVNQGISYPAFRVNMETFLGLLNKYGYLVKVGGTFIPAQQAVASGSALWDSVMLSATKTALFIDIKSTKSAEEIKAIEKQWKASLGAK